MTWICLKCLEKAKHILPNGGLMVIYHGEKLKKHQKTNPSNISASSQSKQIFLNNYVALQDTHHFFK